MTAIGRLSDADPRTAWAHEAHDFTPWLHDNLDQLGDVIGRALEPEGREVAVGPFSADILARDLDGNLVLIENQLEGTNHTHLGQIMTYLAGLEAKIVVWIATDFREQHLSAINWLNEHTVEPFAFFAIKLRVVRIGDSAPAPIFDVLVRPNEWERRMHKAARETVGEESPAAESHREFWARYLQRHPQDEARGVNIRAIANAWFRPLAARDMFVSLYRAKSGEIGVFLRGPKGMKPDEFRLRFAPQEARFAELVGGDVRLGDDEHHPVETAMIDAHDPATQDAAIDWLHARAHAFADAADELFAEDDA